MLRAADLFCGAGGTSAGAKSSGAVDVKFALNHWDVAIKTHSANFPGTKHVNSRLDMTHPSECPSIDLLFASPECTHHSNARGGRPMEDQRRAGAWDVLKWIEHHRPTWVVIENVREFKSWGPLDKSGRPIESMKGKYFDAWFAAVCSGGYKGEAVELNAADFGAATSRNRLFIIFRKGKRSPRIPEPTHSKSQVNALPGMGLAPWRSAAEIIDWPLPCPSIFSRKRHLADKTLRRIEMGLRKFVGAFVAQWDQTGRGSDCVRTVASPLYTMVTKANMGLALPYMIDTNHGDRQCVLDRSYPVEEPVGVATNKRGKEICLPFLTSYYGTAQHSDLRTPVPTIVTKDRHCIILPEIGRNVPDWRAMQEWESEGGSAGEPFTPAMMSLIQTMEELGVADIGFRMLANHELSLAQGFNPEYHFYGTKADITRQIGNSVSPPVAEAISRTIAG